MPARRRSATSIPAACVLSLLALCVPMPELKAEGPVAETGPTHCALGLSLTESASHLRLTEPEPELVVEGLSDGILDQPQYVSADKFRAKIYAFAEARTQRAFQAREHIGAAYRVNVLATRQDAAVMTSGVIAHPVRTGSGAWPDLSDTVRIAYIGSLAEGAVFEPTQAGTPLTVSISQASASCLARRLVNMRVGFRQRLICPPHRDFVHPKFPIELTLIYSSSLLEILE